MSSADTATITEAMFSTWANDYRPLLRKMAYNLTHGSLMGMAADDLVQEALIHTWQHSASKWPGTGNYVTWLIKGAHWGMSKVIYREQHKGRVSVVASVDAEGSAEHSDPYANFEDEALDRVNAMTARDEVAQAISDVLTPQQQTWVHLRFWDDLTPAEIQRKAGIAPSYWAQRDKGIKAKLATRLAHLQEV